MRCRRQPQSPRAHRAPGTEGSPPVLQVAAVGGLGSVRLTSARAERTTRRVPGPGRCREPLPTGHAPPGRGTDGSGDLAGGQRAGSGDGPDAGKVVSGSLPATAPALISPASYWLVRAATVCATVRRLPAEGPENASRMWWATSRRSLGTLTAAGPPTDVIFCASSRGAWGVCDQEGGCASLRVLPAPAKCRSSAARPTRSVNRSLRPTPVLRPVSNGSEAHGLQSVTPVWQGTSSESATALKSMGNRMVPLGVQHRRFWRDTTGCDSFTVFPGS
jgi:hypothetical protein